MPNGLDIHSKSQTKVTNYLNENTEKNNLPVKTRSFKHKQIYEWPTKNHIKLWPIAIRQLKKNSLNINLLENQNKKEKITKNNKRFYADTNNSLPSR